MKKLSIIIMLIIALTGWGLVAYSFANASVGESPFDYSNCQYPTRLTNPVNGCDNSDPACPIQKDGTELCTVETPQLTKPVVEYGIKDTVNVCK